MPMRIKLFAILFLFLVPAALAQRPMLAPRPAPWLQNSKGDSLVYVFPLIVAGAGYEIDLIVQNNTNESIPFHASWYNTSGKNSFALYFDDDPGFAAGGLDMTLPGNLTVHSTLQSHSVEPRYGFMIVWVKPTEMGNPGAMFLLNVRYKPNGVTVTEATIMPMKTPLAEFSIPVYKKGIVNGDQVETGFALTNPDDADASCEFSWINRGVLNTSVIVIPSRSEKVQFVGEYFPTMPQIFEVILRAKCSIPIFSTVFKNSGRNREVISTVPLGPALPVQ